MRTAQPCRSSFSNSLAGRPVHTAAASDAFCRKRTASGAHAPVLSATSGMNSTPWLRHTSAVF
eukprot:8568694-Karenia_brevis.AAC.1